MWISVSRIAKLTLQHFRVILLPQNTETKQITHIEAEENALLFAIVKHLHIFLDSHAQFLKTEQRPRPTGDNFRTLECWNRTDQLNLPFLVLSFFWFVVGQKKKRERRNHSWAHSPIFSLASCRGLCEAGDHRGHSSNSICTGTWRYATHRTRPLRWTFFFFFLGTPSFAPFAQLYTKYLETLKVRGDRLQERKRTDCPGFSRKLNLIYKEQNKKKKTFAERKTATCRGDS